MRKSKLRKRTHTFPNKLTKKNHLIKFQKGGASTVFNQTSAIKIHVSGTCSGEVTKIINAEVESNIKDARRKRLNFFRKNETDKQEVELNKEIDNLNMVSSILDKEEKNPDKRIILPILHGHITDSDSTFTEIVPDNCMVCYLNSPHSIYFNITEYSNNFIDFVFNLVPSTLEQLFKYRSLYSLPDNFATDVFGNDIFIECLKNSTWIYPRQQYINLHLTAETVARINTINYLNLSGSYKTIEKDIVADSEVNTIKTILEKASMTTSFNLVFIVSCQQYIGVDKIYLNNIFQKYAMYYDINTEFEKKINADGYSKDLININTSDISDKKRTCYCLNKSDNVSVMDEAKGEQLTYLNDQVVFKSDNHSRQYPILSYIFDEMQAKPHLQIDAIYFYLQLSFNKKLNFSKN